MNNFITFYNNVRKDIQDEIKIFNNNLLKEENIDIKNYLEYFTKLNENGKNIRGVLISLAYSFKNKDIKYSYPLSLAYEIFETSILVHDDIIDNDDYRRGIKTIHKEIKDNYNNYNDNNNLSKSIALCCGDLAFYKANNIIINNYHKDKNIKKILNTIRGEILDIITPYKEKNKIINSYLKDDILNIYKLKTSIYTIVGPLILGMTLADYTEEEINIMKDATTGIGIAFQIQDDILGIFSDYDKIGKIVGSDISEFKTTLLYYYVKETKYYNKLLKYYGKDNIDIEEVRKILIESNSLDNCINTMNELYNDAKNKINKMKFLNSDNKKLLIDLVNFLKERKK